MEVAPGCTKTLAGEPGKTVLGAEPAEDARGGVTKHRGGPGSRLKRRETRTRTRTR